MRCVTLHLPPGLVRDARLYAANPHDLDAVCYVIQDYGRLVAEVRQLRSRVADLDAEGGELETLVDQLRVIAAQIAEL